MLNPTNNLKRQRRTGWSSRLFQAALNAGIVITACCAIDSTAMAQEAAEKVTYDDHVKPILVQRCSSCHNGQKREGDLDVSNYINLMQGGGSGAVIEPTDSGSSFLYQLITHEDSPEMPPSGTKIPAPEIQKIAQWIDMGALENKGSKAAKGKPKFDMAMSANPTARPEVIPMPLRMPLEPVIKTARPSLLTIATSPWAPIAAISAPKQVLLYNTQSLELVGVLPMEEGVAHSLRFSRNGQLLLAGGGRDGASGKTVLFNVLTGQRITTVGDELEAVLASDISPNHELIAIGGPSKLVKILSTADGSVIAEIKKHTDWVTALEFSPDGKFLVTGDRNGGLHVWEADSGNEVFTLKGHSASITGVSWRADSAILCSVSEDATVRLWELKNGKQIKSWGAHSGGVTSVEFQRDGNIVTAGRDKVAKSWDQAGKVLKQFSGLADVAVAVSFCDESKRVLAGDWSGQIRVWNLADAAHLGNLAPNPPRLAERLAAAQTLLVAANAKHAPLAQQVQATKTTLEDLGKALSQSKQTQVQLQAKLGETEKLFNTTKQQFESTQAQHAQWRKELDEKNTAHPLITELQTKAVAALAALPNDPELKTTSVALQGKVKQVGDRIKELNGLVAKSNEQKNTTKMQLDKYGQELAATKTEMGTVVAQVTKLQKEFGEMTEKMKSETQAAGAAFADVQSSTGLVQKWTSNIEFIAQLKSLQQKLQTTKQLISKKQTIVDAAQLKVTEAQKELESVAKDKSAVEQQADAIKQQVLQLRGGK